MTTEWRPVAGPQEFALFNTPFPYILNPEIEGDLAAGRRRPEWLWLALDNGEPVARAGFWSRPGDALPAVLDIFDLRDGTSTATAAAFLESAMDTVGARPQYTRFLPRDWHGDAAVRAGQERRTEALARTGAEPLVERLRLQWPAGGPVPQPTGRLVFRPPTGDDEILALMVRVLDGTLDAHSRDDLTRMTPQQCARDHFDEELARYDTPRDWWRVALTPAGDPVGFVIPAHNGYNPIIAYLGVVPGHRGNHHIDDILGEGTRVLTTEAGADRIRAATDVGNVPMAKAFGRAGYRVFERQLDMVWPAGTP